jgi:hypothetical protein
VSPAALEGLEAVRAIACAVSVGVLFVAWPRRRREERERLEGYQRPRDAAGMTPEEFAAIEQQLERRAQAAADRDAVGSAHARNARVDLGRRIQAELVRREARAQRLAAMRRAAR